MKNTKGFTTLTGILIVLGLVIVGIVLFFIVKDSPQKMGTNTVSNDDFSTGLISSDSEDIKKIPTLGSIEDYQKEIEKEDNTSDTKVNNNNYFVVDTYTGANVSNPVFIINAKNISGIDAFLSYTRNLAPATYAFSVEAPGYKTMTGAKISAPDSLANSGISLEPLVNAHDCPTKSLNKDNFKICGYVTDQNHNLISNVKISSSNFGTVSASTGSDGYFETEFSPLKDYKCGEPVIFTFSKSGYKKHEYILNGPYIYKGGDMSTQISLTTGSGSDQHLEKHGLCQ